MELYYLISLFVYENCLESVYISELEPCSIK